MYSIDFTAEELSTLDSVVASDYGRGLGGGTRFAAYDTAKAKIRAEAQRANPPAIESAAPGSERNFKELIERAIDCDENILLEYCGIHDREPRFRRVRPRRIYLRPVDAADHGPLARHWDAPPPCFHAYLEGYDIDASVEARSQAERNYRFDRISQIIVGGVA